MSKTERAHPDFCIVGAPKCGTTALYNYLSRSDHVFVPSGKEPHFFSFDFPRHRMCQNMQSYLSLFDAADSHQMTGEGSVWYLYSDTALPALAEHRPDTKIIIMLRNPVDAAYSLHAQKLFSLDEDVRSFHHHKPGDRVDI